jgi:3',5'-cyclic AMP phosphodiesterase CpdA
LALAIVVCGCTERSVAEKAGSPLTSPPSSLLSTPKVQLRRPQGAATTLFATSDTHFGYGDLVARNTQMASAMQGMTGRVFPDGTALPAPDGVLIAGDLTEQGSLDEWSGFLGVYGPPFPLPVYENVGNHDNSYDWRVWDRVAQRHDGHHFYAVDLGATHVISLGEAPDKAGIAFLAEDLRTLDPCVPLVVVLHRALLGPWSTDNWFNDGPYPRQMADLLRGRNVVAILHGHHHAEGTYVWNDFTVVKVGAVKDGPSSFVVLRIEAARASWARFDWSTQTFGTRSLLPRKACP